MFDLGVLADVPSRVPTSDRIAASFAALHEAAYGTFRPIDRRELRSGHWGITDHLAPGS